jgi:hypothetical protein
LPLTAIGVDKANPSVGELVRDCQISSLCCKGKIALTGIVVPVKRQGNQSGRKA